MKNFIKRTWVGSQKYEYSKSDSVIEISIIQLLIGYRFMDNWVEKRFIENIKV